MNNLIIAALLISQAVKQNQMLFGSNDLQGIILLSGKRDLKYQFNNDWAGKPTCQARQGNKTWKYLPVTNKYLIIPDIDLNGESIYYFCAGYR